MTPEAPGARPGRVAARLARVAERSLADVGLTLPQYRLLSLLSDGSLAATAVADHLAVSRPNVTALVDGLVERHLVERRPDTCDRRRVSHVLTTEGRATLTAADAAVERRFADIAAHLPPDEAGQATAALGLWADALDASRESRVAAR